jgi:hypothetical protein
MAAGGALLPSAKGAFSGRGPGVVGWGRSPEKAEPAVPQGAGLGTDRLHETVGGSAGEQRHQEIVQTEGIESRDSLRTSSSDCQVQSAIVQRWAYQLGHPSRRPFDGFLGNVEG